MTTKGPAGVILAGQVEPVGGNVTQFKPGDDVFGWCQATFAEYVCSRVAEKAEAEFSGSGDVRMRVIFSYT
jgi:hypothetical protein